MALPISYNWRNLFVRKLSTGLTFAVVTVVVVVLSVLLSFAAGISESLSHTGSPLNVIVLKPGATAESTSIITNEELPPITQTPGVARSADGTPLVSRELCTQTSIPRLETGAMANVAVRGVDDIAFDVHTDVKIVEGRRFNVGPLEAIVGKSAATRYANLRPGESIHLGRKADRIYTIVGVFEAGGGALESEVWANRGSVSNSYSRTMISSVSMRMADEAAAEVAIKFINGPTVRLAAKQETTYYADLSKKTAEIVVLSSILIAIMSIGAAFAVANTMYAAVDGRRREIAMLRTIGFTRGAIITSFMLESVLICLVACGCGLAGGYVLTRMQHRQDFLSDTTWTVLAYDLKITPLIAGVAIGMALIVGIGGALAPAMRASRIHIIDALRKA